MAWCFEDQATTATETVLNQLSDERAAVPSIWPLEVANVLLSAERRGRLSEAQSNRFLTVLSRLPIDVDHSPTDLAAIAAAGRHHALTSYDASYLLLAEQLGAPLAT